MASLVRKLKLAPEVSIVITVMSMAAAFPQIGATTKKRGDTSGAEVSPLFLADVPPKT
jgi:hypothetical protein